MTELLDTLQKTLGDTYEFVRELTGGGMSRLFLAQDRYLGRKVVVKVLSEQVAGGVRIERFRREIQVSARLQHPHIVPLLSSGEIEGLPYFIMPFIEGESLKVHLQRSGELPIPDAVRLLHQIASALAYAHKNGVVHRDIKPDNVLLSEDIAVVTDFGIARAVSDASTRGGGAALTSDGSTLGTPAYMAPEQVVADPTIDQRADIYSFGVVAYEMLTNTPLFSARGQQAMMAAHAVTLPEPIQKRRPTIPAPLAQLVMQCLEKSRADRPQTAQEIMRKLATWDSPTDTIPTVSEPLIATPTQTPAATIPALPAGSSRQTRFLVPALIAALVIIAGGVYFFGKGRLFDRKPAVAASVSSIAVLPLVNVGGNSSDEYLSEGMTDELANALSKLPGMRIASRTSVYSFKNRKDIPVTEIGKRLNVEAVVEGTIQREGGRLRVRAQLTNVADGLSLWSDTFERDASDVFGVQENIARSVAQAVQPTLGLASVSNIAQRARGTENPQAYDLYLRGLWFFNKRGAANLRESIRYLGQAIAADSNFARAYATLATASALLPEYTDTPPAGTTERGRAAAMKALSIDNTIGQANAALGLMAVHEWNFSEAGSRYRAALAQEPGNPTVQQWYAEYLFHTNHLDSALAHMKIAEQLDPFAPIIPSAKGYNLLLMRRYSEAIESLKQGIARYPDVGLPHVVLGIAELFAGNSQQAVKELETANRLDPELVIRKGELGYVYGMAGRRDDAQRILKSLQERTSREKISATAVAEIYMGLKDYPNALAALKIAVEEHDIALITSMSPLTHPAFDPIRRDPQFQELLSRMNLAQ